MMTRPEAMRLAQEMRDDWTPTQIVQYLEGHGVTVSARQVKRWASGETGAEDNRRRTAQARNARVMARMTELRARGLSIAAVATVLSVDYEKDVTADQVRYCLKCAAMSRDLHRLLFDDFVPGALRTASPRVESRPESTRGEPQVGGRDARLPTPSPFEGRS